MKKNFISALCAALALSMCIPVSAVSMIAEEPVITAPAKQDNSQPTTEQMEEVIKNAKPLLDVPENLSEFEWDYYGGSTYSDPSWTLRWSSKPGEAYEYISVSCDKLGRITNYNHYISDRKDAFPKYKKADLIDTAKAFIGKIAPGTNLYFDKANDAYGRYSGEYTYTFKRTENGIDYTDNSASVRINNVTGAITSASVIYDFDIPVTDTAGMISAEKAAEIIGTKQAMNLSYTLNRTVDDDGNVKNKAVLVYTPAISYISVDAKTGEIYLERSVIKTTGGGSQNSASDKLFGSVMEDAAESEGGYRLTEEELAQLEVLKGLITKEEAVKKITDNKDLYLDVSLTAINADLSRKYDHSTYSSKKKNEDYVWNISFSNPSENEEKIYYYAFANAQVDAKTGEIISFDSTLRNYSYYEQSGEKFPEKKFTEKQTAEIFENFAKANIPEKFENTVKTGVSDTNTIYYKTAIGANGIEYSEPQFGAYHYNYTRVNEGINFTYDHVYGGVDAVTGKIYSFGYSWTNNLEFESPANAIGEDKALEIYLSKAAFDKYYERYDEYVFDMAKAVAPEEKFRALVMGIKQDTKNFEALIDKYAQGLDKEAVKTAVIAGDMDSVIALCAEYFEVPVPDSYYFYNSLDELYEKTSVARLVYKVKSSDVRIGALTGERVDYSGNPYTEAYAGDFTDIQSHWAKEYITILADMGIVKRGEKFNPDEYITKKDFVEIINGAGLYFGDSEKDIPDEILRLHAVKLCIDSMGYGKIAALGNVFKTDFYDNPSVPAQDVGYVAIAWGFSIIDGYADTNTFCPDQRITRAEAAKLIVKTVEKMY